MKKERYARWGVFGAVTHAIVTGRLFRSPRLEPCCVCRQLRHGEHRVVLYDRTVCESCIKSALTLYKTAADSTESQKPLVRCSACDLEFGLPTNQGKALCRSCAVSLDLAIRRVAN